MLHNWSQFIKINAFVTNIRAQAIHIVIQMVFLFLSRCAGGTFRVHFTGFIPQIDIYLFADKFNLFAEKYYLVADKSYDLGDKYCIFRDQSFLSGHKSYL